MWLWWLMACGWLPVDSQRPERVALEAWRDGVQALEEGEPIVAIRHFQVARRSMPGDPLLLGWEAAAAAEDGQLEQAVELCGRALLEDPFEHAIRYNRASYLARLGRIEAAAADLRRVVDAGFTTPREVASDRDFEPWLGHESLDFLPETALSVTLLERPDGPVFVGSDIRVSFQVFGAGEQPVGITAERLRGPVTLRSVEESILAGSDGMVREYRYLWHAEAPGMFLLGPLLLTVGGKTHRLEGLEVEVLGPPDMQAEAWELDSWVPTPMEFSAAGRPRVTQTGEDLLVVVAYGDRVSVSPSPDTDAQELVLRDMDRPRFRALRYLNGGAVKRTVEVFRQGKQVLKTSVGGSPPP